MKKNINFFAIILLILVILSNLPVFASPINEQQENIDYEEIKPISIPKETNHYSIHMEYPTISDSSGNTSMRYTENSTSYTFYGKDYIPDGIYAFQNVANADRWIDIQNDSTAAGSYVEYDLSNGNSIKVGYFPDETRGYVVTEVDIIAELERDNR